MRSHLVLSLAALLICGVVPGHAGEPAEPPPSKKWMAHCAQNLKGEEAEMLIWSQTELERSYPPAHRICHIEARR